MKIKRRFVGIFAMSFLVLSSSALAGWVRCTDAQGLAVAATFKAAAGVTVTLRQGDGRMESHYFPRGWLTAERGPSGELVFLGITRGDEDAYALFSRMELAQMSCVHRGLFPN